jgi:hypothetical protein
MIAISLKLMIKKSSLMQTSSKVMTTYLHYTMMLFNPLKSRLTRLLKGIMTTLRLVLLSIVLKLYSKISRLTNRPARWLYNEASTIEQPFAFKTMVDAINYYPLSEEAMDYLNEKKKKARLYLQSVIEGRSSLKTIADSIQLESKKVSFFDEKAAIENYLKLKLDNNVTIGEWKSYISLINNQLKNEKPKA